jgi:pyruvate/2-oxoglutarate/acetoin dehydrogenase E1 component
LKAPILKVTAPHCPVPFAKDLEDAFVPSPEKIGAAVAEIMYYGQGKGAARVQGVA